jgi:hypothetical protein
MCALYGAAASRPCGGDHAMHEHDASTHILNYLFSVACGAGQNLTGTPPAGCSLRTCPRADTSPSHPIPKLPYDAFSRVPRPPATTRLRLCPAASFYN